MTESSTMPRFEGVQLVLPAEDEPESIDARFLISTLLVYVAKGDGDISSVESDRMIELLSSRYGERSSVIMEHLSSSVMALADRPNIAQTLNGVAKDLTLDEKYEIFLLAVDIAMADGILDQGETQAILFAGQILGLPQNTIYSEIRKISSNT